MSAAQGLLRARLTTQCGSSRSSAVWFLRSPAWASLTERVGELIRKPEEIPADALLKRAPRRLVFLCQAGLAQHPLIVVKVFPLSRLRDRLRHKRYAYNETVNLLTAADLGLPVPGVFGYGLCREMGLTRWNALLLQFLQGRPLREHLAGADALTQRNLLWRVLPLFQKIYQAGCNHIDLGPHAIFLGDTNGARDCLIDFQYCRFLEKPDPRTLAAQAGYFGWCLTTYWNLAPASLVTEWFETLLDKLSLTDRSALGEIFRRRLLKRASIRERLAQ